MGLQQRTSLLLAGLALGLTILACSGCTPSNNPPEAPTINAPTDTVFTGETVNLAVFSVDPDGDTLEYFWSAGAGAFSDPFARSTTWTAPANEGSHDITVEVSDGRVRVGNSRSIEVIAREPGVFLPGTRFPETGSDTHIHFKETVKVTPPVDDISVRSVPEEEIQSQLSRLPGDVTKVIITLEVKPDELIFAPPAELNFYLAGQGYSPGDVLDVLQYDEQRAEWLPVGVAVVDANGEFAVGNISHTTLFALVERVVTVTLTPTWTPTAAVTSPPPTRCFVAPPPGWQLYIVRRGDTLFSLARRTGTTVATIQQVNCLPGDRIDTGQQIWLPSVPQPATPTVTQTPMLVNTPTATVTWTPTLVNTPTATATWTPTPTATEALPDLIVENIGDVTVTCSGAPLTCETWVSFTVANVGAGSAGAFNISIVLDPSQSVVVNQIADGLAAGERQTFFITSPPGGNCYDPDCTISITVDSSNVVTESNEGNNKLDKTYPG